MAILGVRIEFYDKVGTMDEPSEGYLGAIYRDHGFRAAAVPGVGELFSLTSLRVGPREGHVGVEFTGFGPFLPVRFVEHYPTPIDDDGETPAWWDSSGEPSANVVVHTRLHGDEVLLRKSLQRFAQADSGWVGSFSYGTDLYSLWNELQGPVA
ncbi:hypothetical protein [Streptomyces sp. NPDC059009]|uniref:hypothetical protein n=1 Tax=Streptomyces sp. NPDC059009 TaxID=3346694 RepID=UPI003691B1F4